jgi:peptidoglycan L-alanyl-D-glutamate endopeptidase CwlK
VQAHGLVDLGQAGDGRVDATRSGRASNDSLALQGLSVLHSSAFLWHHPAATVQAAMLRYLRFFCFRLLGVTLVSFVPYAGVHAEPCGAPSRPLKTPDRGLNGPGGVYATIPAQDEYGRDQLAMFRSWNPDPVGNHETNLRTLHPVLARVVQKKKADNPNLRFVIGSGRRDGRLQRMAVAWGWSRTQDSPHRTGRAVDLWPLDRESRISFDPQAQNRIAVALRKAAGELGVPIRWGGRFHGFKDMDRSHFELVPP